MQSTVLPTTLLIAVIVVLFVYGWRRTERAGPVASLLVSVGIFGTFLGIAYALYGFDAEAVDESVPSLLSGMRLAFVTSVAGIFFAVLLRARAIIANGAERPDVAGEAAAPSAGDAAARAEQHEELIGQLAALRRALASAEETSVATQLRLVREELARHGFQLRREAPGEPGVRRDAPDDARARERPGAGA